MPSTFAKNLELLKEFSPLSAEFIKNTDPKTIEWQKSKTRAEEDNLCLNDDHLHSQYNALNECARYLDPALFAEDTQAICIYGIGLGYAYFYLKEWLAQDKERMIVFVEEDTEILYRFLERKEAHEILTHPQVHIFHRLPDVSYDDLSEFIACKGFGLQFHVTALPYYGRTKHVSFEQFRDAFYLQALTVSFICREFITPGSHALSNLMHNLYDLSKSRCLNLENNAFKNTPAIIVGAGPSLEKQLDQIKSLTNQALILAGGSAVNALNSAHIQPHFGGTIDPNEEQAKRIFNQDAHATPYFYSSRTHRKALSRTHGDLVYLPYEEGFYQIHDWLHEKFSIKALPSHGGISIPHILTSIATFLGCSPIIFVGLDHAYTKNQLYASGIINNASNRHSSNQASCTEKDIYGEDVETKWEWVTETKMLSNFVRSHPEIKFINATEGGLPILGARELPLKETSEKFLKRPYDMQAKVHAFIHLCLKQSTEKEKLHKFFLEAQESINKTIPISEGIINHLDRLISALNKSETQKMSILSQSIESSQKLLENEPAFKYILSPLGFANFLLLNRRFEALGDDKDQSKESIRKKFEMSKEESDFFLKSAQKHQEILSDILPKA